MNLQVIAVFLTIHASFGHRNFQKLIPNGNSVPNPCVNDGSSWPGVGHLAVGGHGPRNVFGEDFASEGNRWTRRLCEMDSDGDGVSNGVELGDPHCVFNVDTRIRAPYRAISHPGVCEPLDKTECQKVNMHLVQCNG